MFERTHAITNGNKKQKSREKEKKRDKKNTLAKNMRGQRKFIKLGNNSM